MFFCDRRREDDPLTLVDHIDKLLLQEGNMVVA
jgi:hypothetical protein